MADIDRLGEEIRDGKSRSLKTGFHYTGVVQRRSIAVPVMRAYCMTTHVQTHLFPGMQE